MELGRSPSTVTREIRRNIQLPSADGPAQRRAQKEPSANRENRRLLTPTENRLFAVKHGWSV
uniref:hypothetical protein n=1 Tax=Arthrobacter oryzae TaxID=409290 RepID=UPI0035937D3E